MTEVFDCMGIDVLERFRWFIILQNQLLERHNDNVRWSQEWNLNWYSVRCDGIQIDGIQISFKQMAIAIVGQHTASNM